MTTVTVLLAAAMVEWVETQTESGRFEDVGDYIRDLIRREQERSTRRSALRRFVDAGEASGVSPRTVGQVFAEARAVALERSLPERAPTGSPGTPTGT